MHRNRLIPIAAAFTLLALLSIASPALAVEIEETVEKSYDLGAGGSLSVANVNGGVRIEAWDRDEVRVEAIKKVKAGSRAKAEDVMDAIDVVITRRGDHLEIDTRLPRGGGSGFLDWMVGNHSSASVSYKISVPRSTDVEIDTVNGGVRVAGVAGRVEASTTNGGIQTSDLRGSVRAGTTNGAIDVAFGEVADGREMRLSTTNGGISLRLPRNVRASIDADTTNGGINLDGIDADLHRKSRRHLEADLNGGGAEIRLTTTNGGIRISGG
jgi:hypothetical protein